MDDFENPRVRRLRGLSPAPEEESFRAPLPKEPKPSKALVFVHNGRGWVFEWDSEDPSVLQYLDDAGGSHDGFSTSKVGVDHALENGLWSVTMRLIDNGEGDWPGSREVILQFTDEKPATDKEWDDYLG